MCDSPTSEGRSTAEGSNWLIALNEIKHEPEIKEEPMETGDLVELPPLIDCDDEQPVAALEVANDDGGNAVNPVYDIKVEVKDEYTEKEKKKSKLHGRHEGAVDNRRKHHSLGQSARDAKKTFKGKGKQHQCNECGYFATCKSKLETHSLKHTGEKPFPCIHCPKEFKQKHSLQSHLKMHVEEFLFNCAVCLKGFDQKTEKLAHEKDCRIRRYECHLCKYSFGSMKGHLMDHFRIHTGAMPFQCEECSKHFNVKSHLKRHMETHAGPRAFHCSKCHLRFVHQNKMIVHEQKCSRRLYECYVCGKFIGLSKRLLAGHIHTHTGEKPFQCVKCPSKFTRKSSLIQHTNRIHK